MNPLWLVDDSIHLVEMHSNHRKFSFFEKGSLKGISLKITIDDHKNRGRLEYLHKNKFVDMNEGVQGRKQRSINVG